MLGLQGLSLAETNPSMEDVYEVLVAKNRKITVYEAIRIIDDSVNYDSKPLFVHEVTDEVKCPIEFKRFNVDFNFHGNTYDDKLGFTGTFLMSRSAQDIIEFAMLRSEKYIKRWEEIIEDEKYSDKILENAKITKEQAIEILDRCNIDVDQVSKNCFIVSDNDDDFDDMKYNLSSLKNYALERSEEIVLDVILEGRK